MVSENEQIPEISPVTKMQPLEEMMKTPSGEIGKGGTSNTPITVEKTAVEGDNRTKKVQEEEENSAQEDYEAFKKFQLARKTCKKA